MKNLKSIIPAISGSLGAAAPVLLTCCKSTACIGVCASPVASLLGISTAGLASSPLLNVFEPVFIAVSAVSFTISYYRLYKVAQPVSCATAEDCGCSPSLEKEKRSLKRSRRIFWLSLAASVLVLGYFEFQKYRRDSAADYTGQHCTQSTVTPCCTDTTAVPAAASCCDTTVTD